MMKKGADRKPTRRGADEAPPPMLFGDDLARMQAMLAAIVGSTDDAIVSKDLEGTITSWNAGAERVFGYAAAEAIGRSITMLLPRERLGEEEKIVATLLRGERIDHFETERVRKDGSRLVVSLSISPIKDADGRIVGGAKIARDVTLRKRLETEWAAALATERAAREAAEAANRAKDTFLSMVSHELRTPLSPILTWAHILRSGMLNEERSRHALETIERNAHAQAQLIDDLLDVSRIVAGKLRLDVRPVALATVVEAAIEVVRPAADAKRIALECRLDPGVGRIAGDPARLQQVAWNLLANAVKFTSPGGHVRVDLRADETHVRLAVRDDGEGIDPAFLPRLFEHFEQAETGTTRRRRGLGLGLAIVRHLVELHGGTVGAESGGEGQGATFTIALPRTVWPQPTGARASVSGRRRGES